MTAKIYGSLLRLPAIARDFILPHRWVYVDTDVENKCIHLRPTDDECKAYKLSLNSYMQASIAYCYAHRFMTIKDKTEMPITLNEDGSLTLHIPCAEGN
jgi:hypothetical protein